MKIEDQIREGVLTEFSELAKIPRQSTHEKEVSNYLYERLQDLGLTVQQDDYFNIIADKPATVGYENVPRTVLQGHMDMVCVAAEGLSFDPIHDAIKVVRDDEYLCADGTSLGADDGIGVAEILYLLQCDFPHGSLRVIFTVDEEQGMTGAVHLDAKYLADVQYVINCDSEQYDVVTVSAAGSVSLVFNKKVNRQAPQGKTAYAIRVTGLRGGHSGESINEGRGNAIYTLTLALLRLQRQGISFELADFHGGMARNAIPATAVATIVTDASLAAVQAVLTIEKQSFDILYSDVEPAVEITAEVIEGLGTVMDETDCQDLLNLLGAIHTGVYAMSQTAPGLVADSANLGVVSIKDDNIGIQLFARSAQDEKLEEFKIYAGALASLSKFSLQIAGQGPSWAEKKNSKLLAVMTKVFEGQNSKPMTVAVIHAGLECGWFCQKNPNLDIVSIGVTNLDIHSCRERIELATIVPQVNLIKETLTRLKDI